MKYSFKEWTNERNMNHQPFIQNIHADYHENGPRLAYADWLEEHGDPRGELIRIQIALQDKDKSLLTDKKKLEEREKKLLADLELPENIGFYKGLPDYIHTSLSTNKKEYLSHIANLPSLNQVSLNNVNINIDDIKFIINSNKNIINLKLSHNNLDDEAITLISHYNLHFLSIDYNKITDEGVQTLVNSNIKQLYQLDLGNNRITDIGVTTIAQSDHFSRLFNLDLDNNPFTEEGVRNFINSPHFPALKYLYMRNENFSGLPYLNQLQNNFPELRETTIGTNHRSFN